MNDLNFFLTRFFQTGKFLVLMFLLLLTGIISLHAQKTITGFVKDETNEPIPGANVFVKGTSVGTITDIEGNFTLDVPSSESILVISFVGQETQEIIVGDQTNVDVNLKSEFKEIDEVVVIGYGVQKRSDLTGAVTSVKAEEIQKVPTSDISTALQGKASGVFVSSNTGAPGADITVRIRGISTLTMIDDENQGKAKWIVDGIPADPKHVNPNDVESIEILKDAAAAAIYGSNGANGVILVTTKKGKSGKAVAQLNYYHAIQTVPNKIELVDGPGFGKMYTEYEAIREDVDLEFPDYQNLPSYDYQDLLFRDANMEKIDFSVSGGSEKLNAYFGFGYTHQDGIMKPTELERFNFRINSDYKANDWLKIGETMSYNFSKTFGYDEWEYFNEYQTPIINAITVHPYLPPYDETGNFVPKRFGYESPFTKVDLLHKQRNKHDMTGTLHVTVEPVKGLSLNSRLNGSLYFGDFYQFWPTYDFGNAQGQSKEVAEIERSMDQNFSYNWQSFVTYQNTLLESFNFSIMTGYEVGMSEYMNMRGLRIDPYTEEPEMWYLSASQDVAAAAQNQSNSGKKNTYYSYLGRVSADYMSKYLVQFNFRRDYSSKFGPKNRFGNFPGFSAGWKFSEESFIKETQDFLSFGKIRYGWGQAGIDAIPPYFYFSTANNVPASSYYFDNATITNGGGPDILANEEIKWERVTTINYGVDLAFLSNKLSLTVERFERENDGMLVYNEVPGYAGWEVRDPFQESDNIDPRPIVNVGKISNKGWEITTGWKSKVGKLSYSVDINYTYIKNKAISLGADSLIERGNSQGVTGFINRTKEGGGIGEFYGYEIERLFQPSDGELQPDGTYIITNQPYIIEENGDTTYAQEDAQPGDFKFIDADDDGRITSDDYVSLGNPFPKHLIGISMNFEYGWFDLSMFWQGTFGNKIFNATKYYGYNYNGLYTWQKDYADDHYRLNDIVAYDEFANVVEIFPANRNSENPRLDPNNRNGNLSNPSSFYVESGSYLRLKNIQLGMSLPQSIVGRMYVSRFRIYIGAMNLITFTKYSGMDPELRQTDPLEAGIDKAAYPQARVYTMGVNITF